MFNFMIFRTVFWRYVDTPGLNTLDCNWCWWQKATVEHWILITCLTFLSSVNNCVDCCSVWLIFFLSPSAKPVRPGHFSAFSPANPSFLRGYSDHPIAFHKAGFPSSNKQEAPAPTSPEGRSSLNETNGNRESSDETSGPRDYNFQDDVQDNTWVFV